MPIFSAPGIALGARGHRVRGRIRLPTISIYLKTKKQKTNKKKKRKKKTQCMLARERVAVLPLIEHPHFIKLLF